MRVHIGWLTGWVDNTSWDLHATISMDMVVWARKVQGWPDNDKSLPKQATVARRPGLRLGSVAWSVRRDGMYVMMSGERAGEYAAALPYPIARVSRLDIAVDLPYDDGAGAAITQAYRSAVAANNERPGNRRYGITIISNQDEGRTLYIGSRSSNQMARIYDKYKESGRNEDMGYVRYEVELHDTTANETWRTIQREADKLAVTAGLVAGYLDGWGVYEVSQQMGGSYGPPPRVRDESDAQKRLDWLQRSVQGTTRQLVREVDINDILIALGLTDAVRARYQQSNNPGEIGAE